MFIIMSNSKMSVPVEAFTINIIAVLNFEHHPVEGE